MSSLIKVLLKIPGLQPSQISSGLKVPPLNVFYADNELDAQKLKTLLEKFGAICKIEDTKAMVAKKESERKVTAPMEAYLKSRHRHNRKFRRNFWISVFLIIGLFAIISSVDISISKKQNSNSPLNQPKQTSQTAQSARVSPDYASPPSDEKNQNKSNADGYASKPNHELKNDIKKNPYNADAWKTLADNLEKQGDTVAAQQAKESYDKAVKMQMVLANLARAFGNRVRVEIREDAVYYRTSYDFTEREFYAESAKLLNSLSEKFPGKDLIVENYTSDNKFQSVELKSLTKPKSP